MKSKNITKGLCAIVFFITFLNLSKAENFRPEDSVKALEHFLALYGAPVLHAQEMIASKELSAPKLTFGKQRVNNTFDSVDNIKKKYGGTATVFVRAGEEFVRVSTNVIKDDGTRAIGTTLAKNKAYETIMNKEMFCGRVDILGHPYDTCYAPILDAKKNVLGIYYTGYKVRN